MPKLEDDVKVLKMKIDQLTREINQSKRCNSTEESLINVAKETGGKLRDWMSESECSIKDKIDSFKEDVSNAKENLEETVETHPIIALVFAFLIGVTFSIFFGKKS
ncbi:hypothetical protein N9Y92_02370 [Chlamydiales bacterium]|nr:hypothetical protein [Chlamydiales bacterium]